MHINELKHLRNDPRIAFKNEIVDGNQLTIVSYSIADSDMWALPHAKETRGITFDESGRCISRPLHKFFNVDERPETQMSVLNFDAAVLYEKRDGSMLTPVLINDRIHWKTKKSFYSDVAIHASRGATQNVMALSMELLKQNITPVFEYTSPFNRIVIDYGDQSQFVLLAARHINTGEYVEYHKLVELCAQHSVQVIKRWDLEPVSAIQGLATAVNFEGYVVHHLDGTWTKAKSQWYLINHRIMTGLRERDIALAVVEEVVDDLKSLVVSQGKQTLHIDNIEHAVVEQLKQITLEVQALHAKLLEEPSRKDAAVKYSKQPYFSAAMCLYSGKEPNIKHIWKTQFWKQHFSLKVVFNENFSQE